ncbi:hypothetical protein PTKIN_Ptkin15bG0116300 [Pterospermum kingtungense]
MRKASLSFLSRFREISPLFSRNYVSGISPSLSSSSSPIYSTGRCAKAHVHGLNLKTHPFQANPSRNIRAPPQSSSLSGWIEVDAKPHIVEAFDSAKTAEEMLAAFQDMEASFDDADLGLASLKVGLQFHQQGKNPEKALFFAHKAVKALDQRGEPSLLLAIALHLMGSVNITLKRFDDSLECLNRADSLIGRLKEEGVASVEEIMPGMHAVQLELANVKTVMGRRDEALENFKKALEILEMTWEMGSEELGVAYRDLANSYLSVSNFKQALPLALKALDIHKKELGHDSVEVAHDRRVLGAIYFGAGEHKKALEQFELSRKVFKQCNLDSELLSAEMDAAKMQISLGKFDEAINTLKGIIQKTKNEKDSENQAGMFILIGKALCDQGKFADSKGCLDIARKILDRKEAVSPRFVAQACADVATVYEAMDEFETAVSLLERALALIEKELQEQHAKGTVCARIGWILLSRGEVPRAIPYLESDVERLKESFACKHFVAGHNYNNLRAAYLESERPQSAAEMFAAAKDILDVSRGPHDADSIVACQNLSIAYSTMGRVKFGSENEFLGSCSYSLAVEFQQQVIDALKSHGRSAPYVLAEAHHILEELKRRALGTSSNQLPTKAMPLPRPPNSHASRLP